uniref:VP3 n=1 Tax=Heliothis armigera cypovirus 14 TaxID=327947 RepID=Q27Q80_9REOV|nr:unknown [Heliothis armigera cypovirus 14]
MDWSFFAIKIDDRVQQDPRPNEILALRTQTIDRLSSNSYTYDYDATLRSHSLQFKAPWNYVQYTASDYSHSLFQLPTKYADRRIPTDELQTNIKDFRNTIQLPAVMSNDPGVKYNLMMGLYARAERDSCQIAKLLNESPQLLNYVQPNETFVKIMRILNIQSIELPILNTNIFDTSAAVIKMRIWNVESPKTLRHLMYSLNNKGFATTHMSWHYNIVHTFHYTSGDIMMQHVASKIYEDWKQKIELNNSGFKIIDRVCQRLIPLCQHEQVRRITAVGSLYPIEYEQGGLDMSQKVMSVIDLADYYFRHENARLKQAYDAAYNQHATLFFTKKHMDLLNQMKVDNPQDLYYPLVRILDVEYIDRNIISNSSEEVVPVILSPYGQFAHSRLPEISLGVGSSVAFNINTVTPTARIDHDRLFAYTLISPNKERYTADERATARNLAAEQLRAGINEAQSRINNTVKINHLLSRYRALLFQRVSEGERIELTTGTLETLAYLYATYFKTLTVLDTNVTFDQESAVVRAVNNSTAKLLTAFIALLNARDGLLNAQRFGMKANESLLILGAEREPAGPILQDFHKSKDKVRIIGIGDRGISPNIRARIPLSEDHHLQSTFIISDMDQTRIADGANIDELTFQTIRQIKYVYTNSSCFIFKLNYPSQYLINEICDTLRQLSEANNIRHTMQLVRMASQNPYTAEAMICVVKSSKFTASDVIYFDDSTPAIRRYAEVSSARDTSESLAYSPQRHSKLQWENASSVNGIIAGVTTQDDFPMQMAAVKQYCREGVVWRSDLSDNLVNVLAHIDHVRVNFQKRAAIVTSDADVYATWLPNGVGFSKRTQTMALYKRMSATLMHKYTLVLKLVSQHGLTNFSNVISIGGRNLAEAFAFPMNSIKYTVHRSCNNGSTLLLETHYNIYVQTRKFDFNTVNETLEPNSQYLALFVIMTNVDGTPRNANDQYAVLHTIAEMVNASGTSIFVVNYYNESMISNFQNMNYQDSDIKVTDGKIQIADYEPVPVLSDEVVLERIQDLVNVVRVEPSFLDIAAFSLKYGVHLDEFGGLAIHGFVGGVTTFILSAKV